MKAAARGVIAVLAALACLAPCVVCAASPEPGLDGTYVLDPAASDDVHRAIDALVAEMGGLRAPFARMRLRKLNQPPRRIDVAYTGSEVSITTDGRDVIRTSSDGRPVPWKRDDGEEFMVRTVWNGRTLQRTFVAEDGQRENTYVFSRNGATLTLRVVLTSPQLPGPLAYTLVYRRSTP
jgi:hypothetical protein